MSFIQCKNEDEVEAQLAKLKFGFTTEDHRIYDKIQLGDDAMFLELDAKTVYKLHDLQCQIEAMDDHRSEKVFSDLVSHAKDVQDAFKELKKLLKNSPIKKRLK